MIPARVRGTPVSMRAHLLILALLATGLPACGDDVVVVRTGTTELRFQNPPTEVDILLVVDDSCSMGDEQEKLGAGFDDFVTYFDEADVDYHIGITTTDMSDPIPAQNWPGGPRGRLVEDSSTGVRIITRDTADPADVFRRMVSVGIAGSGLEQGLAAAVEALTEPLASAANDGFLREEALLSVIFISDEEDGSNYPVDTWINDVREVKGQRSRDAVNVSALTGVSPETGEPEECGRDPLDPNAGAVAALRYHDVAVRMNGVVASICENEFTDIVARMGLKSSRLLDRFELGREPREDSLEVTIILPGEDDEDGLEVPPEGLADGRFAWALESDEETWWVRFLDIAALPPIDTKIVFAYEGA